MAGVDFKNMNDIKNWRTQKDLSRNEFMTDEDMCRVNNYISDLNQNVGSMGVFYAEWDKVEEAYKSEQPKVEGLPNSRMNIVNSSIEGIVSQLKDNNIGISTVGQGPDDEQFAEDVRIGLDWVFRQNKITSLVKTHERRRVKFGTSWYKVVWNPGYAGVGLAKIYTPALNKILIDKKIKDPMRYQEADYIAETINVSKTYAVETYGIDKAVAISYGQNQFIDNGVFHENFEPPDDDNAWTLILYWSRQEGKLRLQEFSACGVLLYDSHKEGTRKDNQKEMGESIKSYYKYVSDKYPYFINIMYPIEGELYGFGDGKLMLPLQDCLNEYYDKIRIIMRPNINLIDIHSDVDVTEFDDNSFEPVYFDGAKTQGRSPIYTAQWGNVSPEVFGLIDRIHTEAQRVIRFSDLMLGQAKSADTATEAAIQQQQGTAKISDEKSMSEIVLSDVAAYCLGLMIELSDGGKFIKNKDKETYGWIDFTKFANVPIQKPSTSAFKQEFEGANPGMDIPETMNLEEKGKPVTKSIELDIEISVGSKLPKNPAFLWSMIEKLSQLLVLDTTEQQPVPKPALNWEEVRDFMKNYLGIPIKTEDQAKKFIEKYKQLKSQQQSVLTQSGIGQQQGQEQQGQEQQMPNALTEGMTAQGNVNQPQDMGQTGPMGRGLGGNKV